MRGQPLPEIPISDAEWAALAALGERHPTPDERAILDVYLARACSIMGIGGRPGKTWDDTSDRLRRYGTTHRNGGAVIQEIG